MSNDYIPQQDGKFLEWVKFLFTYVYDHADLFGIDVQTLVDINRLTEEYDIAWEKAEDPNRGKADVLKKNETRDALKKETRKYVKEYLEYNSRVTDDDRKRMGLPIHKTTRTPAPVADDYPDADIDTSVIGRVTIHFFEKGSRHKKGKPAGQHGAEIAWIVSDTPPTRWDELLHSGIVPTRRSRLRLSTTSAARLYTSRFAGKTRAEKKVPGAK
jgi:hypothetical protein